MVSPAGHGACSRALRWRGPPRPRAARPREPSRGGRRGCGARGAGRRMSGCEGEGRGASDRHLRVELQNWSFAATKQGVSRQQTECLAPPNREFCAAKQPVLCCETPCFAGRNTSLAGPKHEFRGAKTRVSRGRNTSFEGPKHEFFHQFFLTKGESGELFRRLCESPGPPGLAPQPLTGQRTAPADVFSSQ